MHRQTRERRLRRILQRERLRHQLAQDIASDRQHEQDHDRRAVDQRGVGVEPGQRVEQRAPAAGASWPAPYAPRIRLESVMPTWEAAM